MGLVSTSSEMRPAEEGGCPKQWDDTVEQHTLPAVGGENHTFKCELLAADISRQPSENAADEVGSPMCRTCPLAGTTFKAKPRRVPSSCEDTPGLE